ncbi:MAG: EamA family transporter [Planctomycetota bacterium]|jgi:drug/metabolite transporter (DMT)-like permease
MVYLLIVSLVWAFSFGLIKGQLTGLDSNFVAFARIALSFLIFLPFLKPRKVSPMLALRFVAIGAVQFGVMYVTYIYSYQFLLAHQVALYTIFTPIYVTLINDLLDRRIRPAMLFTSALAIVGAYIIVGRDFHDFELKLGFLILQASNICFALGQVLYKRTMSRCGDLEDKHIFGWLYLGALIVTAAAAGATTDWAALHLTARQCWVLLYLGVLASGICFFLWNLGATRTHAGTLAVFNNLKIPLAVACSLLFFGEEGDIPRLLLGGGIIGGALFLNGYFLKRKAE